MTALRYWLVFGILVLFTSCQSKAPKANIANAYQELPVKLSDLGLFTGALAEQQPAPGVYPYELRTPLFSDYTLKYRFIKLPGGEKPQYLSNDDTLQFPVETIIAKTFAYPKDQRHPEQGKRLIETRILRKQHDGWQGVSYLWNDEQTEAIQKLTGKVVNVEWTHYDGKPASNAYIVPNANQCKGCHGNSNDPIGPRPRNLLHADELLKQFDQPASVSRVPVWNDPQSGSLHDRAKAWLDINCAHCHNPTGPARQSGLDLRYVQHDATQYGIMKMPVAAGRGSGGRHFDIVPGKPDESIMMFRLQSNEPGIMMPELPRRMVDAEGVALIREWISSIAPAASPK